MKYGIFILLGIVVFSCRSTRNSSAQLHRDTNIRQESTVTRKDSLRTMSTHKDSTAATIHIEEYTRTTTYGDDGRVSSLQEQWRQAGSSQLSVSTRRKSDVSVNEEKTDSTKIISESVVESVVKKNSSDTRPVQGSEWIYVFVGAAIGLIIIAGVIIFFIRNRKK